MFPFFLFCRFGSNVTFAFKMVSADIYQLDWHEYPMEVRKLMPIIIALTQKRIFMHGYDDTQKTHSVFKKVTLIAIL